MPRRLLELSVTVNETELSAVTPHYFLVPPLASRSATVLINMAAVAWL